MSEVIFIRHGEAQSNIWPIEHAIVGSDLELTELGIQQSKALSKKLGRLALDGLILQLPARIYTSPYKRAKQTAGIIAREFDMAVVEDVRLQEIQKGDWHGIKVADILPKEHSVTAQEAPHFRPPMGENWFDVAKRMEDFITEHQDKGETTIMLVSHNHPIETAIGAMTGMDVYDWDKLPISNGSISRLVEKDGIWSIDQNLYNNTAI